MAPNLWLYQILLVALVFICLVIHVWWPDPPRATSHRPRKSDTPRRTRSKVPQPFPGFIHKPLCAACEQGADSRPKASRTPPPLLTFTRGRRRTVDTRSHFCPAPDCSYHGWRGRGNIRANGHPGAQLWRQLQCVSCHGYFSETHGTMFHGKRSAPELIVRVIACLAEGLGIRGTARVFESDPNTVLQWLVEAAEQIQTFSAYFLHELHINQVQLDELYAVLSAVRNGDMGAVEAIERLSRSPHWVWTAIDPESKLLLNVQVGERTLAMAHVVLHQLAQLVAPGCVPLFVSDGYSHYLPAIVAHFWPLGAAASASGHRPGAHFLARMGTSDFPWVVGLPAGVPVVPPYPLPWRNPWDLPSSRLCLDDVPRSSTPVRVQEPWPTRLLCYCLPCRGACRHSPFHMYNGAQSLHALRIAAHPLPVDASPQPLPTTTQHSVPGVWPGLPGRSSSLS